MKNSAYGNILFLQEYPTSTSLNMQSFFIHFERWIVPKLFLSNTGVTSAENERNIFCFFVNSLLSYFIIMQDKIGAE